MHTPSSLEGTLTAGQCIQCCLPEGNATIFINGTSKDINLISRGLKHDSSGGISLKLKPLALGCTGILPWNKVPSHVSQIQRYPSRLVYLTFLLNPCTSGRFQIHACVCISNGLAGCFDGILFSPPS